MEIVSHTKNGIQVAEVISNEIIIATIDDGSQLLNDLYYQGFDYIIIRASQLNPDFFELKTGMAGEILQKFSNRRVRQAIVGDFSKVESKSMSDFIFESNKGRLISFVDSVDAALQR